MERKAQRVDPLACAKYQEEITVKQPLSRSESSDGQSTNATWHPEWIWRNGVLTPWENATIHVKAVGHASVSAIFEGIRAYRSSDKESLLAFRLEEHLDRLLMSARLCRLHIPYTTQELHTAIVELLIANEYEEDVYIRPWAFPGGLVREMMVPSGAECEVVIDTWPMASNLSTPRDCTAAVSSWVRINEASMPPRAKTFSNYHNGRLAVLEARANGHDIPILLNERGKVSEGPGACIALVRDGVVITPSLTNGVLESITRDSALVLLREAGIPVEEREVDRTELYLADEVFFLGTAWEILPVTILDGLTVGDGKTGRVAALLEESYTAVVRGEGEGHKDWVTEVPRRPKA
ncbi:branched-chain amino acid transaminase [Streptomyces bikiniensis]|uniref:Branched-chain-amino-acid aminotransferase n=1 Tax=Streptomyces bikiniensis TaxID=1896 RepID=A0ABW8D1F0_STRBI